MQLASYSRGFFLCLHIKDVFWGIVGRGLLKDGQLLAATCNMPQQVMYIWYFLGSESMGARQAPE